MKLFLASVGVVTLAITTSPSAHPNEHELCRVEDIQLSKINWHLRDNSNDRIVITGEITNRCRFPTGVELAFTFKDDKGRFVQIDERWPASTANIPAGGTYVFNTRAQALDPKFITTEVRRVYTWGDVSKLKTQ